MCRNIKPLYNFEPPVTDDEIRFAISHFTRLAPRYPTKVIRARHYIAGLGVRPTEQGDEVGLTRRLGSDFGKAANHAADFPPDDADNRPDQERK